MSNMLSLIQGLQHIMKSDDWTDSPQRKQMAEEYNTFCQSYAENIARCQQMLDRKMLVEATDFSNNQDPPLSQQLKLLNFEGLADFRILCQLYDWPEPPELDAAVLEQLRTLSRDAQNFQPLLNAYRQIVRTDNVKMKVLLLRRLVQMDQNSGEWKTALEQQEKIWMDQLILQAKNMIIENDFASLEQQFQKITDSEWGITPPAQVVKKISSILENHRLEELKKRAEICLNAINDAYGSFDFEKLGQSLAEWKALISREAYEPEAAECRQVLEAEEYWLQQKKQRLDDLQFESLLKKLRSLMENDKPQDEIDMVYNRIVLMGRDLPEHVEQQYFSMKGNFEIIQRRKRIIKTVLIVSGAAAVLFAAGFVIHLVIRQNIERQWVEQITRALNEPTSLSARNLIRDLKKNDPSLYKRPAIAALVSRAEKMHEKEERLRKIFIDLEKRIRMALKNYERNRDQIRSQFEEMKKLAADQAMKDQVKTLGIDLAGQEELFQIRKRDLFEKMIAEIRRKRGNFYIMLEQSNYDKAQRIIKEIAEQETAAGNLYELIRHTLPGREQDFGQSAELQNTFSREFAKFNESQIILGSIRAPSSLGTMIQDIQNYLNLQMVSGFTKKMAALMKSAQTAKGALDVLESNALVPGNIFAKDKEKAAELRKRSAAAAAKLTALYNKWTEHFSKSPIYSVVGKLEDNTIVDFYYQKASNNQGNDTCFSVLDSLLNEYGKIHRVRIEYRTDSRELKITLPELQREIKCLRVYPNRNNLAAELQRKTNISPHIRAVGEICEKLNAASKENIEPVLIESMNLLLVNYSQQFNCILKFNYLNGLFNVLFSLDPDNPDYKDYKKEIDAVREKIAANPKLNWLQSYKNGKIQKEIDSIFNALEQKNPKSRNAFFLNVWEKIATRKLTPAGFIEKNGGEMVLRRFSNAPESGELWAVSLPYDNEARNMVIGHYSGTQVKLLPGAPADRLEYTVLLTPANPEKTERIDAEIRKEFTTAIDSDCLPQSWPVFANEKTARRK